MNAVYDLAELIHHWTSGASGNLPGMRVPIQ
jgi:hypothetical protein